MHAIAHLYVQELKEVWENLLEWILIHPLRQFSTRIFPATVVPACALACVLQTQRGLQDSHIPISSISSIAHVQLKRRMLL